MNKSRLEQWIEALRSGEYGQETSQLRTRENGYCCLGVLCDLYGKDTGRRWGRNKYGEWTMHASASMPTKEVLEWLGAPLKRKIWVTISGLHQPVDNQNDSHERTFGEIADALEREHLPLAV